MSPASQGGLHVDHYIGTSLISTSARVTPRTNPRPRRDKIASRITPHPVDYLLRNAPCHHVPGVFPNYAGVFPYHHDGINWTGASLISMAPIRGKRTPIPGKGPQLHTKKVLADDERTPLSHLAIHTQGAPLIHNTKCNVPRKPQIKNNRGDVIVRRNNKYKDGRGAVSAIDNISVASDESSGSGQLENILPRIIKPRKRRKKDRKPGVVSSEAPVEVDNGPPEVAPRSHSVGVPDDPQLHHRFEDVAESDLFCPPQSSCQCHYCDPSGIWDAPATEMMLRRSWSEPLPSTPRPSGLALQRSYSMGQSDAKEVHWESLKGCDISEKEPQEPVRRAPCLEVSTEIVSSLQGHRDLEIRFYSSFQSQ